MSAWKRPTPSRGPDDHGAVPEGIDPVTGLPYGEERDRTVVESVRASLRLLTKRDRRLFILAAIVQMSLGLLDLIGVALIGIVGAVAVSGIDPTSMSPTVQEWIDRLGLGGLTASQLVGLFALVAVLLLVVKTLLSAYLTRRMMRFLANRQADVSARMARILLSSPLLDVQRWSTAEVLYALTSGVSAAISALLARGRAAAVVVLAAAQDPRKEVVSFRSLFPTKIALRLDTPSQVDMVLGDGMHQMGALADRIPAGRPGVGYVTVEGIREPVRVRAAYVTDEQIHAQTLDYPAPSSALLAVDGGDPQ